MKRFVRVVYDHVAGYLFLCWLFQRPVIVMPPSISRLFDAFSTDDDRLQTYLDSHGLELPNRLLVDEPLQSHPKKFSEISKFSRSHDLQGGRDKALGRKSIRR